MLTTFQLNNGVYPIEMPLEQQTQEADIFRKLLQSVGFRKG